MSFEVLRYDKVTVNKDGEVFQVTYGRTTVSDEITTNNIEFFKLVCEQVNLFEFIEVLEERDGIFNVKVKWKT